MEGFENSDVNADRLQKFFGPESSNGEYDIIIKGYSKGFIDKSWYFEGMIVVDSKDVTRDKVRKPHPEAGFPDYRILKGKNVLNYWAVDIIRGEDKYRSTKMMANSQTFEFYDYEIVKTISETNLNQLKDGPVFIAETHPMLTRITKIWR